MGCRNNDLTPSTTTHLESCINFLHSNVSQWETDIGYLPSLKCSQGAIYYNHRDTRFSTKAQTAYAWHVTATMKHSSIWSYKAWSKSRKQILPAIARLLAEGENVIWSGLDNGDKMQILMDITKTYQSLKVNIKTTTEVEFHARRLLYRIHTERYRMLRAK